MSTTNREKRKQAKRKARERTKKNGTNSLRSKNFAPGGTVGDWIDGADNRLPPEDGKRLRLTVQDPEGLSCDTAKWALRMLCQMDASVWAVHDEGGSIHLTDRGRWVQGAALLWARFRAGQELTIVATGPDADEALEGVRALLSVPLGERKALYRARYLRAGDKKSAPTTKGART
jgi:phosphotransferase system HPr-like phosphotransfer protein